MKFLLALAFAGMVVFGVTGCGGSILAPPALSADPALTQVAQTVESIKMELQRVAPTLTAYAVLLLAPQSTPEPVVSETSIPPTNGASNTPASAQATSQAKSTMLPSPTLLLETALSTRTPVPTDKALYLEDFTSPSGWYTETTDSYTLGYSGGGYRIYVSDYNRPIWSTRSKRYTDARIEVDAVQSAGPTDGYYGLVCRMVDSANYYLLVVSQDGNFAIGKVKDNGLSFLASSNEITDTIKLTGNRLRADCIGNTLALYVDGSKVLETSDSEFTEGSVGIAAGNRTEQGTDTLFDNFSVLSP